MIKNSIISTKGTTKKTSTRGIILGFIVVIIGMIAILSSISNPPRNDAMKTLYIIFFVGALLMGTLCFITVKASSKTYLNVYSDHVEGNAFSGDATFYSILFGGATQNTFYLTNDKIKSISCGKIKNPAIQFDGVFIHTNSQTYKIATSKECAEEIFKYFNNSAN